MYLNTSESIDDNTIDYLYIWKQYMRLSGSGAMNL